MFYATNKPRLSTYHCTPSGKQNQGKSLDFARFVRSSSFFPIPVKGAVKKLSFFYSSFYCCFILSDCVMKSLLKLGKPPLTVACLSGMNGINHIKPSLLVGYVIEFFIVP